MTMFSKGKQFRNSALFCLLFPVILALGCGKENSTTGVTSDCSAPFGSTISITPSEVDILGTGSGFPINFTALVQYPDGNPMPKACVNISGSLAAPSSSTSYTFYYYPDGPGRVGNVAVASGYDAQTDDFGAYSFSIVVSGATGSFVDDITVKSGAVVGMSRITY